MGRFRHTSRRLDEPPSDALISNVNVVPFVGERVVIIQLGEWQLRSPRRHARSRAKPIWRRRAAN